MTITQQLIKTMIKIIKAMTMKIMKVAQATFHSVMAMRMRLTMIARMSRNKSKTQKINSAMSVTCQTMTKVV